MIEEISKLQEIFKRNGDRTFIVDSISGQEFKYNDIEELSLKLATILDDAHIKKGDKIAIILPNCIEFIIIYFACMQIGAISIPINSKLHPEEIKYILSDAEANFLFISSSIKDNFSDINNYVPKFFSFKPTTEINNTKKGEFLEQIFNQKPYNDKSLQKIKDDDTIIIIYTSGTTKRPKGVIISYKNIIDNGFAFAKFLNLGPDLRFYAILDLAYLGGFYNLMLIPFFCQGSIVLDKTFNPQIALNFWDKVKRFHINALWLVPSILSILLSLDRSNKGADYCKKYIKIVLVGTAPLSTHLKKRFEEKYSVVLYENYGLSETFFITTNSPYIKYNKGVGKVMPGCEISIVDENGDELSTEKIGEITVKTKYVMNGYYKNPEEDELRFKNGKFFTGDIGYIDKDGYLFVTDRKKDIIIRGGINISPREIEEVIMSHSIVKEVAVVGIQDEYSGEKIVAFIEGTEGLNEKDIKLHCQKHLASFKVPEKVFFEKDFPRSVTGKIQKNKLKEISIKRLNNGC